jgi:hypothetical protein
MVMYQRPSRMMQILTPDEAEEPELISVVDDMEPAEVETDYWA